MLCCFSAKAYLLFSLFHFFHLSNLDFTVTKHDPYEAFRVKAFRLYALGWVASLVGSQIQGAAIGWEMYARTGQALALGLVGLAIALPTMILALPAGYLADRYNRRTVMMLSMAGTTLTSLGLAVLSWKQGPIYLMYGLLVLDASITVLGAPARRTIVPQIVPREVFPNAVAWSTSLMQASWMVGPAIGGLIAGFMCLLRMWQVPHVLGGFC